MSKTKLTLCSFASMVVCVLALLWSCDVHEFPNIPEMATLQLKLHYTTDMPQWEHEATESKTVVPSKSVQTSGEMRYVIRFYPGTGSSTGTRATRSTASHEFVFTRDITDGYDAEFTIDVPTGDYTVMVWSDLGENKNTAGRFYNADDFSGILLRDGTHEGNNDYRDAFRGIRDIRVTTDIMDKEPETVEIEMERPMAKFEFVATDLEEFIDKEVKAAMASITPTPEVEPVPEDGPSKVIDMNDYKVVFYYVGYMPNTFNMFTDKPSDSVMGVNFVGRISRIENGEASMGFDYVLVNGKEASVTVRVGIYDKNGKELSMSNPVNVPLLRSKHTLIKGRFMMQEASGGVGIDPSFSGDYNIML